MCGAIPICHLANQECKVVILNLAAQNCSLCFDLSWLFSLEIGNKNHCEKTMSEEERNSASKSLVRSDRDEEMTEGVREVTSTSTPSKEEEEMRKMGLPSAFTFHNGIPFNNSRKRKFYCDICLTELNSEDTLKSHIMVSHVATLQPRYKELFTFLSSL